MGRILWRGRVGHVADCDHVRKIEVHGDDCTEIAARIVTLLNGNVMGKVYKVLEPVEINVHHAFDEKMAQLLGVYKTGWYYQMSTDPNTKMQGPYDSEKDILDKFELVEQKY